MTFCADISVWWNLTQMTLLIMVMIFENNTDEIWCRYPIIVMTFGADISVQSWNLTHMTLLMTVMKFENDSDEIWCRCPITVMTFGAEI